MFALLVSLLIKYSLQIEPQVLKESMGVTPRVTKNFRNVWETMNCSDFFFLNFDGDIYFISDTMINEYEIMRIVVITLETWPIGYELFLHIG